jgi:hypothetical protein
MYFDLEVLLYDRRNRDLLMPTVPAVATIRSKLAAALLACVGVSLAATIAASAAGLVVVTTMLRASPGSVIAESQKAQRASREPGACALPFHAGS